MQASQVYTRLALTCRSSTWMLAPTDTSDGLSCAASALTLAAADQSYRSCHSHSRSLSTARALYGLRQRAPRTLASRCFLFPCLYANFLSACSNHKTKYNNKLTNAANPRPPRLMAGLFIFIILPVSLCEASKIQSEVGSGIIFLVGFQRVFCPRFSSF
jgi:hypothetical protein